MDLMPNRRLLEPLKHSCIGRLTQGGSLVVDEKTKQAQFYDRPVLMVYTGEFESMDGDVEITDKKLQAVCANYSKRTANLAQGEQWDPSSYAPLQLDHSTSARDTIGRVIGPLEIAEETLDGKKVIALKGTARFIGAENIEKAQDGRYTHVSVGMDLDKEELNELSVTPFPAAMKARLLSAKSARLEKKAKLPGRHVDESKWDEAKKAAHKQYPNMGEDNDRFWKIVTTIYENMGGRFSAPGGEKMDKEKLKKYLMEGKKMSADDADKHLAEAEKTGPECMSRLEKEAEEHEKKMAQGSGKDDPEAASKHGELAARMTAAKTDFVKLAKGAVKTRNDARLAVRMTGIRQRMARLRMEAKLSPANEKKIDVAKLSGRSDAEVNAFFEAIELSNPLIDTGQKGTTKAAPLGSVPKEARLKALELETRLNMESTREGALKELEAMKKAGTIKLTALGEPEVGIHVDTAPHADYEMAKTAMKHLEEGKHDEAKEHLKKLMSYMEAKHLEGATGEHVSPDKQVSNDSTGPAHMMAALAEDNKKLQAQVDELLKFMASTLGVDVKELERESA